MKDPLNRSTLYSYDAESNRTQTVAPGDTPVGTRTIAYGYDILNRRTSMNQAAGALVYTYGYDAKDQLTSIADPAGIRTQGYDNAGRLTSVSRAGQTFTYGYDGNGNVRSRTWPDGTTVTSTVTDANQLESLSVAGGQLGSAAQYTFEYDPSGRLSKTTYPTANHLITDRSYDRAGRLSDLNSHNDAGTVARYQVTRDPVGNPTGITTTRGGAAQHVAYTYDVFDRVTAACVGADCGPTATGKIAYSYDQVGNRLSQTLSGSAGNSQTTYTYDSASQLTASTVTTPAAPAPPRTPTTAWATSSRPAATRSRTTSTTRSRRPSSAAPPPRTPTTARASRSPPPPPAVPRPGPGRPTSTTHCRSWPPRASPPAVRPRAAAL